MGRLQANKGVDEFRMRMGSLVKGRRPCMGNGKLGRFGKWHKDEIPLGIRSGTNNAYVLM